MLASVKAQELANAMHSFAQFHERRRDVAEDNRFDNKGSAHSRSVRWPANHQLANLLACAQSALEFGDAQNVSNVLWAVAKLNYTPDEQFMQWVTHTIVHLIDEFNTQVRCTQHPTRNETVVHGQLVYESLIPSCTRVRGLTLSEEHQQARGGDGNALCLCGGVRCKQRASVVWAHRSSSTSCGASVRWRMSRPPYCSVSWSGCTSRWWTPACSTPR